MRYLTFLVLAAAGWTPHSQRPSALDTSLTAYKTFRCAFPAGVAVTFAPTAINGKRTATAGFKEQILFDAIDLQKGTARMSGNAGADDVAAFGDGDAITFFEPTGSGAVMTTVFLVRVVGEDALGEGPYRAVMSRHLNLTPAPLAVSQYDGSCRGLR